MAPAVLDDLRGLLKASQRFPRQRQCLLRQALRMAQQALARNASDQEAVKWLGVVWWRLGAKQRGRALIGHARQRGQGCRCEGPVRAR